MENIQVRYGLAWNSKCLALTPAITTKIDLFFRSVKCHFAYDIYISFVASRHTSSIMTGGSEPLDTKHGQYVFPVLVNACSPSMSANSRTRTSTNTPGRYLGGWGNLGMTTTLHLHLSISPTPTQKPCPYHARRGRGHFHLATSLTPRPNRLPNPKRYYILRHLRQSPASSCRYPARSGLQHVSEMQGPGALRCASLCDRILGLDVGYGEVCFLSGDVGRWAWRAKWCGVRNEYYNSKPGRTHDPVASDEATQGGTVRG